MGAATFRALSRLSPNRSRFCEFSGPLPFMLLNCCKVERNFVKIQVRLHAALESFTALPQQLSATLRQPAAPLSTTGCTAFQTWAGRNPRERSLQCHKQTASNTAENGWLQLLAVSLLHCDGTVLQARRALSPNGGRPSHMNSGCSLCSRNVFIDKLFVPRCSAACTGGFSSGCRACCKELAAKSWLQGAAKSWLHSWQPAN